MLDGPIQKLLDTVWSIKITINSARIDTEMLGIFAKMLNAEHNWTYKICLFILISKEARGGNIENIFLAVF